ncbi:MAG TPA: carboxypeptidase regulatory-like domain-containing protein, partial [Rhodothermales bacterium]|nr:carboxypeptidase regulatory-like domain-containing protein [Rhodothermales bacterium]
MSFSQPVLRCVAVLFLALLYCLSMARPGLAQSRVNVTGFVTDSTDVGLEGATVVALQAADSVLVSFGVTRPDGAFRLRRMPAGDYLLQVTFVGFAPFEQAITVGEEDLAVGRLPLKEAVSDLDELVISAEHVPILIKSDTLEYNAAAFNTRPNANVEELLKRLPGVEVERDGSIKAQGEDVKQVLVDGKEFFGKDPTIATRNLPADAVDKVQVYDKKSEMAEFTGVDDGQEE